MRNKTLLPHYKATNEYDMRRNARMTVFSKKQG